MMRMSFKLVVCFLTGASLSCVTGKKEGPLDNCSTHENQTAYVEDSVTIICKYPGRDENIVKHFCRKDGHSDCAVLISSQTSSLTIRDRFTLTYDKQTGVYNVTMSTLTLEDAGIYWCAITRANDKPISCLSEINLHILNWDDIEPVNLTGITLKTVRIKCEYSESHERSEKILCKGENPLDCEKLINSTEDNRNVVMGRFHIRDNQRTKNFYVNIKDLNTEDSGTYWCIPGGTKYTKIQLSVVERNLHTSPATENPEKGEDETNDETPPDTTPDVIAGIVGALALLAIILALLFLYRRCPLKTQRESFEQRTNSIYNTEENTADHEYEAVELHNNKGNTVLSECVYYPADQIHYASKDFQKEENTVPGKDGSSAFISSAEIAAEKTLYSTVVEQ